MSDESLTVLFEELTEHEAAKDYSRYLFADLLNTRGFYLDSLTKMTPEPV